MAPVRGNDLAPKYNPKQQGKRGDEIEVTVDRNWTVRALRDHLGCLLLALPAGWTDCDGQGSEESEQAVAEGPGLEVHRHRLRMTSWQKEASELLQVGWGGVGWGGVGWGGVGWGPGAGRPGSNQP